MSVSLIVAAAIIGTYGTPPALWAGWRYWHRRQTARVQADAAELAAIDAWLNRIRRV